MAVDSNEHVEDKIQKLEKMLLNLKTDLSLTKQLLTKSTKSDPTGSVAIADLPAISDDEIGDNPQVILEHATGTKRGYLSQLLEQAPDLEASDIPPAVNSADSGSGFGGFRYTVEGTTLNLFTS